MPHGFEDCVDCLHRNDTCKKIGKVKNCKSNPSDLFRVYEKERGLLELFLDRIGVKDMAT